MSVSVNEPLAIELLGSRHDRGAFSSGEPALDADLRHQASQDVRRRVTQVFVAIGESPKTIAGYYTLSATSFARSELPPELSKRLPHYPVPAALLGRLAVDQHHQGRGLGEALLMDGARRVLRASAAVAIYAIIVDAKSERAQGFYEQYGFRAFPTTSRRLFLPLETLARTGLSG